MSLPQGEGTPRPALGRVEALWICESAADGSPSPHGRGTGCTAIELSIGPPSVGRPLPARNERGEGWGEGKSNKNATPLPGPLLLLRRKRGGRGSAASSPAFVA